MVEVRNVGANDRGHGWEKLEEMKKSVGEEDDEVQARKATKENEPRGDMDNESSSGPSVPPGFEDFILVKKLVKNKKG
ncbi:hypothetical protein PIB30_052830 [Stylosanthes scabra]|uniref:Uncharacterized protein n=1 Tax=Stylosanthes scabra TaxID=79078 RepID=A0ABU6QIN8_9FABA|nr:hypothetical protein [Stylosanthes scabra]